MNLRVSESKSDALPLGYTPKSNIRLDLALPFLLWGGRWGLNPRHPESQSGALPTELRPPRLACLKGFEPPTTGLEGRCSILLSYRHIFQTLKRKVWYALLLKFGFRFYGFSCKPPRKTRLFYAYYLEQVMGIGPTTTAWKAVVLPLYYTCETMLNDFNTYTLLCQGNEGKLEGGN